MKKYLTALAGNPNSGKTSVFNNLTGAKHHVGNWPGVTVERKEGHYHAEDSIIQVVDLPGTYGLNPFSLDEKVAREFIAKENCDLITVITDSSNIERNLYLLTEIMELNSNILIVLNMDDIAREKGINIDAENLEKILNAPVVKTSANRNKGTEELKEKIYHTLKNSENKKRELLKIDYGKILEPVIEKISEMIPQECEYNKRWASLKLLENDEEIRQKMRIYSGGNDILQYIESVIPKIEQEMGADIDTIIIRKRYGFIHGLVKEVVEKKSQITEKLDFTDKADKILTNKYLGIPIFLICMWITFQLVFALGNPLIELIDKLFAFLGGQAAILLQSINAPELLTAFIEEGVIGGVGGVIVFFPIIMILYFAIGILEDSGYMARGAFVMDRLMHSLGLHGQSFIPMVMGFGCTVPAVLAARTLKSERDRILTIMLVPFMSCAAKLPIYFLFTAAFFPDKAGYIIFILYLTGILFAVITAKFFSKTLFSGDSTPLIMELPLYRLPHLKSVLRSMWYRSYLFIKKAGTIIFGIIVILWVFSNIPFGIEDPQDSVLGKISTAAAPIFKPAGFGEWQAASALIAGVFGKEAVVGTFGTLLPEVEDKDIPDSQEDMSLVAEKIRVHMNFTPLSAFAFMVMCLLYVPCGASVAAVWKETNFKWAFFQAFYTTFIGWLAAVLIYQIGSFFV